MAWRHLSADSTALPQQSAPPHSSPSGGQTLFLPVMKGMAVSRLSVYYSEVWMNTLQTTVELLRNMFSVIPMVSLGLIIFSFFVIQKCEN